MQTVLAFLVRGRKLMLIRVGFLDEISVLDQVLDLGATFSAFERARKKNPKNRAVPQNKSTHNTHARADTHTRAQHTHVSKGRRRR